MLMGIISLIIFILGVILVGCGYDKWNYILFAIGSFLIAIGIIGVFAFFCINYDTIKIWFKI